MYLFCLSALAKNFPQEHSNANPWETLSLVPPQEFLYDFDISFVLKHNTSFSGDLIGL